MVIRKAKRRAVRVPQAQTEEYKVSGRPVADHHKVWLIAGIAIAVLAIGFLVLYSPAQEALFGEAIRIAQQGCTSDAQCSNDGGTCVTAQMSATTGIPQGCAEVLNDCKTDNWIQNRRYLLSNDLTVAGQVSCFAFENVNQVQLDCRNPTTGVRHTLQTTDSSSIAVRVAQSSTDVTIQNCNFEGSGTGVGINDNSNGVVINDNLFMSVSQPIRLTSGASGNLLNRNVITDSPNQGILLLRSTDNVIVRNEIRGGAREAIALRLASTGNLFVSNVIENNQGGVTLVDGLTGNNFLANYICGNTGEALSCGTSTIVGLQNYYPAAACGVVAPDTNLATGFGASCVPFDNAVIGTDGCKPGNACGGQSNVCGVCNPVGEVCSVAAPGFGVCVECRDDSQCAAGETCNAGRCGAASCGNGVPDVGEQCDDGNTNSGDGCSATCQNEQQTTTFTCRNVLVADPAVDEVNQATGVPGTVPQAGFGYNIALAGATRIFDDSGTVVSSSVEICQNGIMSEQVCTAASGTFASGAEAEAGLTLTIDSPCVNGFSCVSGACVQDQECTPSTNTCNGNVAIQCGANGQISAQGDCGVQFCDIGRCISACTEGQTVTNTANTRAICSCQAPMQVVTEGTDTVCRTPGQQVFLGDLNNDGQVAGADLSILRRHLAQLTLPQSLGAQVVDQNGVLASAAVQRGLINSCRAGAPVTLGGLHLSAMRRALAGLTNLPPGVGFTAPSGPFTCTQG
jgi:cysteine-rich repeat protein/Cys-rich repeat protein/parallel beta-helix repeat protein